MIVDWREYVPPDHALVKTKNLAVLSTSNTSGKADDPDIKATRRKNDLSYLVVYLGNAHGLKQRIDR